MKSKATEVDEFTTQIQSFLNDSTIQKTKIFLKKNEGDWNKFVTAIDTIRDTNLAITNFTQNPNNLFIQNPYLVTYGLLQALFLQQDAVNYLKVSLFDNSKKIDWNNPKYAELKKIRQIRNETIGHPIGTNKRGPNSKYTSDEITYCTINRSSLSKDGFEYMLYMHSESNLKTIKFSDIIAYQDKYLGNELKSILKETQKEERQHKEKFKGEKLCDLITKDSLYQLELIYGVQWNDHLAWPSFDYYHTQYKKIRKGLEDRYGKFEETTLRIPGTTELIKKLDHIFFKLEEFKETNNFDHYAIEVYVDVLIMEINKLKTHLEETDAEFDI